MVLSNIAEGKATIIDEKPVISTKNVITIISSFLSFF